MSKREPPFHVVVRSLWKNGHAFGTEVQPSASASANTALSRFYLALSVAVGFSSLCVERYWGYGIYVKPVSAFSSRYEVFFP